MCSLLHHASFVTTICKFCHFLVGGIQVLSFFRELGVRLTKLVWFDAECRGFQTKLVCRLVFSDKTCMFATVSDKTCTLARALLGGLRVELTLETNTWRGVMIDLVELRSLFPKPWVVVPQNGYESAFFSLKLTGKNGVEARGCVDFGAWAAVESGSEKITTTAYGNLGLPRSRDYLSAKKWVEDTISRYIGEPVACERAAAKTTFENLPQMEGCTWDKDFPPVYRLHLLDGSPVAHVFDDADVRVSDQYRRGQESMWRFPDEEGGDHDFDAAIRWIAERTGIKPVGSAK